MSYKLKHRITCDECGTGYGQDKPLGFYENDDFNSMYLCDECAPEYTGEEDEEDGPEDDLGSVDFCPVCKEDWHGEVCLRTDKGEKL